MHYSLYFFAMDAESVAKQFAEPEPLLNRARELMRAGNELNDAPPCDEEAVERMTGYMKAVCEGSLPDDCAPEYFHALCWLAEVSSEKISIPCFIMFSSMMYLEDIGLWPWFQRSRPPFAVPVYSAPPPEVGFLTQQDIKQVALPGFGQLPPTVAEESTSARDELQFVLETLVEDKLDLLAVLIEN